MPPMKTLVLLLFASCALAQPLPEARRLTEQARDLALRQSDGASAERLLRRAISLWVNTPDPKSPEYAETLDLLGMILQGRLGHKPAQLLVEVEPLYKE